MAHHEFHDVQQTVLNNAVLSHRMQQNKAVHLKRNSMPAAPSSSGGFQMETTLHAYPMVGPHSPLNVWYCDNKKCVYTQHGIYRRYQIQNWRSSQFGAKFVLCDGCVRQHEKPTPAEAHAPGNMSAPNVNVNLDIQGGGPMQPPPPGPAYGQPGPQIAQPTQRASFDHASYQQQLATVQQSQPPSQQVVVVQQPTTIVEQKMEASPSPMVDEQDLSGRHILRRGWMMKKGDWLKDYKKRYFILKSDQSLNYYDSDTSVMIKGTCFLNDVTGVYTKSAQSFEIHTKKRNWSFACKDQETRDAWVDIIKKVASV